MPVHRLGGAYERARRTRAFSRSDPLMPIAGDVSAFPHGGTG